MALTLTRDDVRDLLKALEHAGELAKKAEGKDGKCRVRSLEDSALYVRTWIMGYLETVLERSVRLAKTSSDKKYAEYVRDKIRIFAGGYGGITERR